MRDLGCNGNDHIAIKWIVDKLASLMDRDVTPINDHEKQLADNYWESLNSEEK